MTKTSIIMYKVIFITIIFTVSTFRIYSQANESLYKPVSVSYKNTSIETILADLQTKTTINFSYSPSIFNGFGVVNYTATNQPLKEVLIEILDGGISFKAKKNYIIFQKKKDESKEFLVMGYILNELNNEKITNASIYEVTTLASALSNSYGYYQIRLRRDLNNVELRVNKQNYMGEKVKVPFRKDGKINIVLTEKTVVKPLIIKPIDNKGIRVDTIKTIKLDSIVQVKPVEIEQISISKIETKPFDNLGPAIKEKSEKFMDWLMSTTQKIHFNNIRDSINRPFQMSLVPFIGTNGRMSSAISNDVSINLISGVSKSINKLEVGGFLNLVRENMTGIQLSGFGNIIGKNQTGLQLAGFSNINFGNSNGVISAGFANLTFGKSSGLQMAGFSNFNFNTFEGVQLAGFNNLTSKKMKGLQVAGFINNSSDTLVGSQISTFNIANKMKNGVQIGFFNYINEAENVLPIGFFSFVKKGGYRRLEFATNEVGLTEITFKTGVRAFYNIFSAQYNVGKSTLPSFGFGYGLGTSAKISNRLSTDLNIIYSQLVNDTWNPDDWNNQMVNANLNLEFKLSKRLALFGGPSFSWYTTDEKDFDFASIKNAKTSKNSINWWGTNQNIFNWPGFKVGIRVCNLN